MGSSLLGGGGVFNPTSPWPFVSLERPKSYEGGAECAPPS